MLTGPCWSICNTLNKRKNFTRVNLTCRSESIIDKKIKNDFANASARLSKLDPPRYVANYNLDDDPDMAANFSRKESSYFVFADADILSPYNGWDKKGEGNDNKYVNFMVDATTPTT